MPLTISLASPASATEGVSPKRSVSALTSVSNSFSILPVQIRLPERVRVIADGRSQSLKTTALTVGDVIKELHISLGPLDLISRPLPAEIVSDLRIRITRIKQVGFTKQVKIPFVLKKTLDKKMMVGKRIVKSRGANGLAVVHAIESISDGKVVGVRTLSKITLKPAHAREVIVGIRPRTIDELNWTAVAFCESRGNPRSSNSKYGYFGMFQFSLTAWKTAGGVGNPMDYSAAVQLMRAKRLFKIRGWRAWPVCGKLFWS